MAVDTENKRRAVAFVLPEPDGTVVNNDRASIAYTYGLFAAAVTVTAQINLSLFSRSQDLTLSERFISEIYSGQTFDFDGATYQTFPALPLGDFEITLDIYPDVSGSQAILYFGNSGSTNRLTVAQAFGAVGIYQHSGPTATVSGLSIGAWNSLVFSRSGTTLTIELVGVGSDTVTFIGDQSLWDTFYLAAIQLGGVPSLFFNGDMRNIAGLTGIKLTEFSRSQELTLNVN